MRAKAKAAQKDLGLQLERAKVKTKSETPPNIIARAQAQGISGNTGTRSAPKITETSSRLEIKATCEPLGETRPKCTPAKGPEVVLHTGPIRWLKGRANPKRLRMVLKWEGSIRKRQVITPTPPVDNRKARKNQTNPNECL
jgi:hypothetical protein